MSSDKQTNMQNLFIFCQPGPCPPLVFFVIAVNVISKAKLS